MATTARNETALIAACRKGHEQAVEAALRSLPRGALDAVDVDGLSALMHATLCLRARCPDTERGETPAACFAAYERVVRGLLRAGARVEVTDKHGSNALHHASFLGHARIAAALLDSVDRPEAIDAQRANGESALSVAAFRGAADPCRPARIATDLDPGDVSWRELVGHN